MKELEELENGLQGPLKYTGMHRDATLPTGVRKYCHHPSLEL